jgi:uncharacterized RDD family membrane protein YckC
MRYVGVGRRFLAILIDYIVGLLWTFPFIDIDRSPGYFHAQLRGGGFLASFAISVVYFTVMEGFLGATVGKFMTGIRVVKEDGSRLDVGAALIRNLLRVVDAFFLYLVGAIFVWTSPLKQRLGDRVAKTVVVTAGSVGAGSGVAGPPGSQAGSQAWMPPTSPAAPGVLTPPHVPPPMPPPPPMPGGAPPPPEDPSPPQRF